MRFRNAIAGLCAIVSLSACEMNSAAMHPAVVPQERAGPSAPASMLYVSDPVANDVEVYDAQGNSHSPIATITSGIEGPGGMAVNAAGDLYVANTKNNTVTEYAAGSTSPSATYATDLLGPVDVAVDSHGTLYVANFYSFVNSIVEYASGSTKASTTIRNPCSCYPIGIAIDAKDDLLVDYQNFYSRPAVYTYPLGSHDGSVRIASFGTSTSFAAGMALDSSSNLLVALGSLPAVESFPPGKNEPSKSFGKQGSPQLLAFGDGDKDLFVTDTAHGAVDEYAYPSGTLAATITSGLKSAYGVAVSGATTPRARRRRTNRMRSL